MGPDKFQPAGVFVTDQDGFGTIQPHALQRTDAGGASTQNEHGILRPNLRDFSGPIAGGQHVSHQQCLEIGDGIRNFIEPLVGIGHSDILRLSPVNPTAQGPTAVRVRAVIDPAMPAEEAVPTEGLHIHRHPVAGSDVGDGGAYLLHYPHHLVAHRDAGHRPGDRAVLDVQVAGADAGQGDPDDSVPVVLQDRFGLFQQGKGALLHIGVGQHGGFLLVQNGGGLGGPPSDVKPV